MWDELDKTAQAYNWSPGSADHGEEGFQASYAYTEADELEDALLFPHEASGEMADNLFRNDPSLLEIFEKESIDIRKIAADLDTDDDECGGSDEEFDSEEDHKPELGGEALEPLEDDDEDSNWGTEDESSDYGGGGEIMVTAEEQDDFDETVDHLAAEMKKFKTREPDYFLPIVCSPASAKGVSDLVRNDPAKLMYALRYAFRCQKEYGSSRAEMEADFLRLVERKKSKGT